MILGYIFSTWLIPVGFTLLVYIGTWNILHNAKDYTGAKWLQGFRIGIFCYMGITMLLGGLLAAAQKYFLPKALSFLTLHVWIKIEFWAGVGLAGLMIAFLMANMLSRNPVKLGLKKDASKKNPCLQKDNVNNIGGLGQDIIELGQIHKQWNTENNVPD